MAGRSRQSPHMNVCAGTRCTGSARLRPAKLRPALAAMIGKIRHERIHCLEPRRIDHRAPVAPRHDEARIAQTIEMKGQRVWLQPKAAGDVARRHPVRPGLDQETEYGEAIFLRKRAQDCDCVLFSHISIITETKNTVK